MDRHISISLYEEDALSLKASARHRPTRTRRLALQAALRYCGRAQIACRIHYKEQSLRLERSHRTVGMVSPALPQLLEVQSMCCRELLGKGNLSIFLLFSRLLIRKTRLGSRMPEQKALALE